MTTEPEKLVLELLRQMRVQIETFRQDVMAELRDLKFRVNLDEKSRALHGAELAHHSARFDDVYEQLARINRRLELRDID